MPLLAYSRVLRVHKLVKLLGKMEKSVSNMHFICYVCCDLLCHFALCLLCRVLIFNRFPPCFLQITVSYELVVLLKLLTLVSVLTHMEACLFWFIGEIGVENGWQASVDGLANDERYDQGHGVSLCCRLPTWILSETCSFGGSIACHCAFLWLTV